MIDSKFRAIEQDDNGFREALALLAPPEKAAHPRLSDFGREYYPLALGETYVDHSFVLADGDTPLVAVICGSNGETFSQFGAPIELHLAPGLNAKLERELLRGIAGQLEFKADGEKNFRFADAMGPSLSLLGEICLALEGYAELQVIATIDLTQDTEKIDAAIRKSYRSLINWGKKNLSLEYVNADAPSRDKFLEYQEFHKLIAGRVTRTQESWDAMYKVLENGSGELILGYESGALVSGALIIDGAKVSIYASGAYDRSKFDRPLAHWPLYDGILRAKKRGMRNFELGSVDKASNPSQKEAQIALFKRGFASHLVPTLSWVIPIQKK
jgi:hypothetical protein